MNSHKLAKILLNNLNLPIATHANNHNYMSKIDSMTHGSLNIALLRIDNNDHIVIGNFNSKNFLDNENINAYEPIL